MSRILLCAVLCIFSIATSSWSAPETPESTPNEMTNFFLTFGAGVGTRYAPPNAGVNVEFGNDRISLAVGLSPTYVYDTSSVPWEPVTFSKELPWCVTLSGYILKSSEKFALRGSVGYGAVGMYAYTYNLVYPADSVIGTIGTQKGMLTGVSALVGFDWKPFTGLGLGLELDLGAVYRMNLPDIPPGYTFTAKEPTKIAPAVSLGISYRIGL